MYIYTPVRVCVFARWLVCVLFRHCLMQRLLTHTSYETVCRSAMYLRNLSHVIWHSLPVAQLINSQVRSPTRKLLKTKVQLYCDREVLSLQLPVDFDSNC